MNTRVCILVLAFLGVPWLAGAGVVINEVMSNNDVTLADEDGEFSDWIELFNTGPDAVDLDNHYLTDDAEDLTGWRFEEITLAAGEYLLVFASDKDRDDPAGEQHADFKLSSNGEYLALVAPDGESIVSEFAPQFPAMGNDHSYGRAGGAEGGGADLLTAATPGAQNTGFAVAPVLQSFDVQPRDIAFGESVTASWDVDNVITVMIDGVAQPAEGNVVLTPASSGNITLLGHNPAGNVTIAIPVTVGPEIPFIGSVAATPATIVPGGSTVLRWDVLRDRRPSVDDGFTTDFYGPLLYTPFNEAPLAAGSEWRYLDDGSDQGSAWRMPGFDDGGWASGAAPLGFGFGDEIETEIGQDGVTSYFRHVFDIEDLTPLQALRIRLRIDGGSVVYLNGQEIDRHHLPAGEVRFDTSARYGGADSRVLEFDTTLLVEGENLLAVEVHQLRADTPTLLFEAGLTAWNHTGPETVTLDLVASNAGGTVTAPFSITVDDSPGPPPLPALVFAEFFWDYAGTLPWETYRFFEILNTGDTAIDLGGMQLVGAATTEPVAAGEMLAPGARTLLVSDTGRFGRQLNDGLVTSTSVSDTSLEWLFASNGLPFALLTADGRLVDGFNYTGSLSLRSESFQRIDPALAPLFPDNWQAGEASPGEAARPLIAQFEFDVDRASPGDTVRLLYEVQHAVSATIEPGIGAIPVGVAGSIEIPVLPGSQQDHRYTLTAHGAYSEETGFTELLVQPQIADFSTASLGLQWEILGEALSISISPDVGNFADRIGGVEIFPDRQTLIPPGSEWAYLDDGSDQGSAWTGVDFDDAAWARGIGIFGYGNNVESTLLQRNNQVTSYFRHWFNIADPASFERLRIGLLLDDGAQVFLNGTEILRENLPSGAIDYLTRASGAYPNDGRSYLPHEVPSMGLVAGDNVLAVGLHNNTATSDDVGFDLSLSGIEPEPDYYFYTLEVDNGGPTESVEIAVPSAANSAPTDFSEWASGFGDDAEDFHEDPDGDGRSNGLEFQLGSDPLVPDGHPLQVEQQDGYLQVHFEYNPAALYVGSAGLGVHLEASSDLENWVPASGHLRFTGSVPGNRLGTIRASYESVLPIAHPFQDKGVAYRLGGGRQL